MTNQNKTDLLKMYADGMFDLGERELRKNRYYISVRALAEAGELFRQLGNSIKAHQCENYLKVCEVYSGMTREEFYKLYDEGVINLRRFIGNRNIGVDSKTSRELDEFWKEL